MGFGLRSVLLTVASAVQIVLMLIIELIATMMIYTYLNFFHINLFGNLVRFARSVLDALTGQLEYWIPGSANAAYATLFGELGPKSILLLMLGLVTAAVIRAIVRLGERRLARKRGEALASGSGRA